MNWAMHPGYGAAPARPVVRAALASGCRLARRHHLARQRSHPRVDIWLRGPGGRYVRTGRSSHGPHLPFDLNGGAAKIWPEGVHVDVADDVPLTGLLLEALHLKLAAEVDRVASSQIAGRTLTEHPPTREVVERRVDVFPHI